MLVLIQPFAPKPIYGAKVRASGREMYEFNWIRDY
jgi:hypothetical protein